MSAPTRRLVGLMLRVGVPIVVVALLWVASSGSTSFYFPPLSRIVETSVEVWFEADAWNNIVQSLWRILAGFAIGAVCGVVIGLLTGFVPVVRYLLRPTITFLRSIPTVSLVPVSIILLGIGTESKVAIVAFVCVWPVLLNTEDGVVGLSPTILETARSYRLPWRIRLFRIVIPAISPRIFAGLRVSLAFAVALVTVAEMIASTDGIGHFVITSSQTFSIPEMWSGIIVLGLLGFLLNMVLEVVQRRALHWTPGGKDAS